MNSTLKETIKNAVSKTKRNTAVTDTEEKVNKLYNHIISFFENRTNELEGKMEDVGVVKKEASTSKIVLGTLAGLVIGVAAAIKFQLQDVEVKDIQKKVKGVKLPVKETGRKVNRFYDNFSSYLVNRLHNVEDKMENAGIIEKKNTGPGIFLGILSGLAVGGAAALLLAKDSGEDFRNKVNKNFNKAKEQLLAKKEELSKNKDEALHFTKKETENFKNAATAQNKDFTSTNDIGSTKGYTQTKGFTDNL